MKKILMLGLCISLLGCDNEPSRPIKVVVSEYEILNIDPPKHFYVDLRDRKTGQIWTRVGMVKHCSGYEKLRIGQVVTLARYTYRSYTREVTDFDGMELRNTFCAG